MTVDLEAAVTHSAGSAKQSLSTYDLEDYPQIRQI